MIRHKFLGIATTLVAVMVAGSLASSSFAADGSGSPVRGNSPPTTLVPPLVVTDVSGSPTLTIQLQEGTPATGHFSLDVNAAGTYTGVMNLRPKGGQNVTLHGAAAATFSPLGASSLTPTAATVRMEGMVNPGNQSAHLQIWTALGSACTPKAGKGDDHDKKGDDHDKRQKSERHDGDDHHGACHMTHLSLVTPPQKLKEATRTARKALSYMTQGAWDKLYAISSPDLTNGYNAKQFADVMAGDSHKLISATVSGAGKLTDALGYRYYRQPALLVATTGSGPPVTYTVTIVLIQEHSRWLVFGTSTPRLSS